MPASPILLFPYILAITLLTVLFIPGKSPVRRLATAGLLVLPPLYFFYILYTQTTSIAFIDDYNLLDTFHRMLYAPQASERIKAFFEQVNEHRFAFERALMFVIYFFSGQPDPKIQIFTGNLFLLGILFLFYRFFRETRLPPHYFIPVPLLLFSLLYYENAIWGIAAIQNTPLLFFALLTATGLGMKSTKGDMIAFAGAILISFTSGSGISCWIIGALVYFFQKRYRQLAIWLLVAAGILIFYFSFDYHLHPKDRSNLYHHLFYNIIYGVSFLGSIFLGDYGHLERIRFYPDVLLCFMAGGVMLAVALYWLWQTLRRRADTHDQAYWFMSAAMLFFLATGAMLVVSRPVNVNIIQGGEVFSRRYVIFSLGLFICCYLAVLYLLRRQEFLRRAAGAAGLALAIILNTGAWYLFLPNLLRSKAELSLDPYYVREHDNTLLSFGEFYKERLFWNHPTAFSDLLKRLADTRLYNPDSGELHDLAVLTDKEKKGLDASDWKVSLTSRPDVGFNSRMNRKLTLAVVKPGEESIQPVYLALKSRSGQFLIPALADISGFSELFGNRQYFTNRYSYTFWKTKFPEDIYNVWIVARGEDGNFRLLNTGKAIRL